MKITLTLVAAVVAAAFTAPAHAHAQSDGLIREVRLQELVLLAEAVGGTVEDRTDGEKPWVLFSNTGGMKMYLMGQGCSEGACLGIQISTTWMPRTNFTAERVAQFNHAYAAAKAVQNDEGHVTVSRYVILDEGQTFDNLALNVRVLRTLSNAFPSFVRDRVAEETGDPGVIDWGDDSSRWANDGECDDTRFEGSAVGITSSADHVRRDATDCRTLYGQGEITLKGSAIDWGDDASRWANDGECDDARFEGESMGITSNAEHVRHDATDCRRLYGEGRIQLRTGGE